MRISLKLKTILGVAFIEATLLALLGAVIITVGCGGDPPKADLDAADAALQAAKSAEAGNTLLELHSNLGLPKHLRSIRPGWPKLS